MKKTDKNGIFKLLVMLTMLVLFVSGCGTTETEERVVIAPEVVKMKSICELATMDCYFNNVAKYEEEDASGMWWWTKDKRFWIEYSGVVKIGIDMSLVEMTVEGQVVTITLPKGKVLSSKVDETSLTTESFIIDENSAKIQAEDQTLAFIEAQKNMEALASADTLLLSTAQNRAKKLLESYINNIATATGVDYTIKWIYLDTQGDVLSGSDKESASNVESSEDTKTTT